MNEYAKPELWGKRFHLRIVHSIPGFVCLVNALISPIRLKQEFWKTIFIFCFIYSTFLYIVFLKKGIIQYWFTDFRQGYTAWRNLISIGIGACIFYLSLAKFEYFIKGEYLENDENGKKKDYDNQEKSSIMMK